MTVIELIHELQRCDPTAEVIDKNGLGLADVIEGDDVVVLLTKAAA